MTVDISLLSGITAEMNKRYKAETIHSGASMPSVARLPYDSIELNLASYGGIGIGRATRFWGSKSSCKSLIAWGIAKRAMAMQTDRFPNGMTVCYHDIEGSFDPDYLHGLGIDLNKLTVVRSQVIEDVSENLDSLLSAINLHIIDSASFAESIISIESGKESERPGLDAKAWKTAYKSMEKHMDKQENAVIIIDQARANMQYKGEHAAGGYVADHASSMTLHMRRSKDLYRVGEDVYTDTRPKTGNDDLTGKHRIDAYELEIEVEKSKICKPFGKALLRYLPDEIRFDKTFELQKIGLYLGVIQQSGAYYTIPTSQKSVNGKEALRKRIAEDWMLAAKIEQAANKYLDDVNKSLR